MAMLLVVICTALVFEYINGFHDSANAIATVVSTKVLSARTAVIYAGCLDITGALLGTHVASTIGQGIVDAGIVTQGVIFCALLAAVNYVFYDAQILNAYAKTNERGRTYTVLKLKTADFTLYTTTGLGREFHRFARVNIGIVTKNVKFLDFLKQRFYTPNFKISAETAPSEAKWRGK